MTEQNSASVENDTVETNDVDTNVSQSKLIESIEALSDVATKFYERLATIQNLVVSDSFKLVSKQNRNALIFGLLNESRDIEELSKVTFRALKKVKRERIQEDEIDTLLGIPDSMKAKAGDQEMEE